MPQRSKELDNIGEENAENESEVELEATGQATEEPLLEQDSNHQTRYETAFDQQPLSATHLANRSEDIPSHYLPPLVSATSGPITEVMPSTFKTNGEAAALRPLRRRRPICSPACSVFCEEEEAIFPTRKWTKPLADMGDAVTWKIGVLDTFNTIRY